VRIQPFSIATFSFFALVGPLQAQTFQAGNLSGDLVGKTALEWNTNPTYSSRNQLNDVFWITSLDVDSKWEFTKDNSLSFDLGAEYRDAFAHDELDSSNLHFSVFPNTRLEFLVRLSERVYLQVYDELNFYSDPTETTGVDPEGNVITDALFYERVHNTAGAFLQWELSDFDTLTAGAVRTDINSFTAAYANTELTAHTFSLNWQHLWNKRWSTQLVLSRYLNDYWEDLQNDSDGYGVSLVTTWKPSDYLTLVGDVGYQWRNFDRNGINGDRSDLSGMSWGLEAEHSVNEVFSYSLGYRDSVELGMISNYERTHSIRWATTYTGFNRSTITGRVGYEWSDDSGGFLAEEAERLDAQLSMEYQLGPSLDLNLRYGYLRKWSNRLDREYEQQIVRAELSYTF